MAIKSIIRGSPASRPDNAAARRRLTFTSDFLTRIFRLAAACLTGVTTVHAASGSTAGGAGLGPLIGWTLASLGLSWTLSIIWWIALCTSTPPSSDRRPRKTNKSSLSSAGGAAS